MKRVLAWLVTTAILTQWTSAVCTADVSASCAVVMDAASGRVLWEKNAHDRRPIASITKLMTALVALESGHLLNERVEILPEWTGAEGSSIYLRPGEQVTFETLLYGLLLCSGNDAAQAVAGFCGGTEGDFVADMNRRAEQLGMDDTNFANSSGLDHKDHYSTAFDMALLARACLENGDLARIAATKSAAAQGRILTNHNKLLWRYEGCIGLKTGYTQRAGRTLVSAASRKGMTLICVTLDAPNDWDDHTRLLDEAFTGYASCSLAGEEPLCRLYVRGGLVPFCSVGVPEPVSATLTKGEDPEMELRFSLSELEAPVAPGTVVGQAVWTLNGQELACAPLVTRSAVARDEVFPQGIFKRLNTWLAELSG